jgi:PAS domain S-box-containing protein
VNWRAPDWLNPRRSLRARFALLLGGSGLAFALLAAVLVYAYERDQLIDTQGQAMRREAQLTSRSLDVALQERLRQLRDAAAQPLLSSGLMEPGDTRLLLEALRAQEPALAWLAVTNVKGRVQVATNALLEGQAMEGERWFAEGLRKPWIGSRRPAGSLAPHLGLEGDDAPALIDLAVPLTDPQGRTLGVLVARLRWDWLDALHRSMQDPAHGLPGSEILVLDRDDRVLLGPAAWLDQPVLREDLPALRETGMPRVLRWGQEGEYVTAWGRYESTDGSAAAGLSVLVRQPAELAFRSAEVLRQRLLGFGLLATLVYVALSIWLAARVAQPIHALSAAAQRVSQGEAPNFNALSVSRNDEVAQLAHALQTLHVELATRLSEQRAATERFEALFRNAPVAIYFTQNREVQMANDACLRLFGADSMEELRGKRTLDLVPPEDIALIEQRLPMIRNWSMHDAPIPMLQHRIRRMDGRLAEVESTVMPLSVGDANSVQVVLHDVTQEHEARRLLVQREAQLAQTSRMAQVGGWAMDVPTQQATWTEEMARIYERPGAAAPTPYEALAYFVGPHRAQLKEALRGLVRLGQAYDLVLRLVTPAGTQKWVRAQAQAVWEEGRIVRLEGFTQDITERRAAEEAVRELNAKLEQRVAERTAELQSANNELDSFAYAVSHDLRAPLRAMSGFSQALVEDYGPTLDANARGYLEQIISGSHRMGGLIEGLLVLSRSVRGELSADNVDLSFLAQRVVNELRRAEPQRVVDVQIEPGLHAWGDRRMLDAALNNLIGNAWKYSANQVQARIVFEAREIEGERWFCLTDNGAGFDMAHAGRLFKAFARLHRQDEFPGLGIGLATVQRIIQRHGGRIEAQAAPGQGAVFKFTLPAPRAAQRTEPTAT